MPNQLTKEQLKIIQEKAKPIFEHLERKKALELARALEKRIIYLETTSPELYKDGQKLIAQLKWVACPLIKNDEEFLELVEKYFLEGLELDVNLIDLATAKLELQFGVNLRENISEIITALRNNKQKFSVNRLQIKGETSLAEPSIKNWLLDFIRSSKTQNRTEIEKADYLFNNPNAKKLSENEKKTLGKVLTFFDAFRLYEEGLTIREKMYSSNIQQRIIQPTPLNEPINSTIPSSPPLSRSPMPQPLAPKPPQSPLSQFPKQINLRQDKYQEPVTETPKPGQTEPRIEGNIVDLKRES